MSYQSKEKEMFSKSYVCEQQFDCLTLTESESVELVTLIRQGGNKGREAEKELKKGYSLLVSLIAEKYYRKYGLTKAAATRVGHAGLLHAAQTYEPRTTDTGESAVRTFRDAAEWWIRQNVLEASFKKAKK